MSPKNTKLPARLTDPAKIWGMLYLPFSIFLLPQLLHILNTHLPTPLGNVWFNFIYFSCNFLAVIWIFRFFLKQALIYAGKHFWRFLMAVLAGATIYWLLNWLLSILLQQVSDSYVNLNDSNVVIMLHSNFAVMFVGSVILVPIAEETLHRGLVFGVLYDWCPLAAYLVSTAVFSAVHIIGYIGVYSPLHLILAFLQYIPAGLVLAWTYRFSGSIFAPILIHASINCIGLMSMR